MSGDVSLRRFTRCRAAPLATGLLLALGLGAVLPAAALPSPPVPTTLPTIPTSLTLHTPSITLPSTTVSLPFPTGPTTQPQLTTSTSHVASTSQPSGTTQTTALGTTVQTVPSSPPQTGESPVNTTRFSSYDKGSIQKTMPGTISQNDEVTPVTSDSDFWTFLNTLLRPILPPRLAEVLLSPVLLVEVFIRALLQSGQALLLPIAATAAVAVLACWRLAPPRIFAPHHKLTMAGFISPKGPSSPALTVDDAQPWWTRKPGRQ